MSQPLHPHPTATRRLHRRLHRTLGLATALAVAVAAPVQAQEVELRWLPPDGDIYQGQTFELTLEVMATTPEAGGFVQLFPQPLGLPLQLEGLTSLEQLELMPWADRGECSLVLDGEIVRATDVDPDPAVTQLRLTRLARARRSGEIALPETAGRYAVSSAFREDLVRGSVPVDRVERAALGALLVLDILPLPEAGQPVNFEGAVGPMTVKVSVEPNRVRVGETLQLEVTLLGGSLNEGRAEPRLTAVDGLRLIGTLSEGLRAEGRFGRTFRYDLEATSTAPTLTPTVSLVAFDPEAAPPGYRTLTAGPLPIAIRPGPRSGTSAGTAPEAIAGQEPPPAPLEDADEPPKKGRLIWTPAVLLFIVVLAALSARRRRRSGGRGPQ
jgi:hypothetical protein